MIEQNHQPGLCETYESQDDNISHVLILFVIAVPQLPVASFHSFSNLVVGSEPCMGSTVDESERRGMAELVQPSKRASKTFIIGY
jgi:hypothetical protein